MRPPIDPDEATHRLELIFPRAAFDSVLSSPLAGLAIAALLHVDAVCDVDDPVEEVHWARPSTVIWMSPEALARNSHEDRVGWRAAAAAGSKQLDDLAAKWQTAFRPMYRENSRETLRDETFRRWREHGAMRQRPGLPTSSSRPRWALTATFADLFHPELTGQDLEDAATQWRETHLEPGAKLKVAFALNAEKAQHAVTVHLPDNTRRALEPGISSLIIKGIIETWAPARLSTPVVLAISEPGDKVHLGDEQLLRALGIQIDTANVLPDVLLADIGIDPVQFWIIEAVATDGPVSTERKNALLAWAGRQNIKASACSFLTGFRSRNDAAARKLLKDLASGTWAWFADEPTHELAWYQLNSTALD